MHSKKKNSNLGLGSVEMINNKRTKIFRCRYSGQAMSWLWCLLLLWSPANTIAQDYREQLQTYKSTTAEKVAAIKTVKSLIVQGKELLSQYPDSAYAMLSQALYSSYNYNYMEGAFESLLMLGIIKTDKGEYDTGISFYNKALLIAPNTGSPSLSACRVLNNLGNAYNFLGNFRQSANYYFKSIEYGVASPKGASQLIRTYANLAGALSANNQLKEAHEYLEKAWQMASLIKDTSQMMHVLVNKGTVYEKSGNDSAALRCYYTAKNLADSATSIKPEEQFFCLNNIASVFIGNNEAEAAIPYLIKASKIKKLTSIEHAAMLYSLGSAYYALERDSEALSSLQSLLAMAQEKHIKEYEAYAHELLAELYAAHKNYKQAFVHSKAYSLLNDTLKDAKSRKSIEELEVRYKVAEKNNSIAQSQLLISQQERRLADKDRIIIAAACVVVLTILVLAVLHMRQRHRQEMTRLKAGIEGEERERKRIAQDLHDGIGSTLVSATMEFTAFRNEYPDLMYAPKYNEALERLDYIYKELRRVAHNLTPEILLQHGLVDTLALFCEQISHNLPLKIDFEAYGSFTNLEPQFTLSIYRIVQELLHNVAKHAHSTHCLVQLHNHEHLLSILVEDNGKGFKPEKTQHGVGLKNLDARIRALNGEAELYSSAEKGTSIYLNFDLKTRKNAQAL